MNRREFLDNAAKVAMAPKLGAYVPDLFNVSEDTRQRLWYSSHCCCCGYAFPARFLADLVSKPAMLVCEFCKWHVIPSYEGDYVMPVPPDWLPT